MNPLNERKFQLMRAAAIMLCASIVYAWSVFVNPLIELHGWSLATVALVGTVEMGCHAAGMLVGGRVRDKIGPRAAVTLGVLCMTLGIIGTSFVPSSSPWLIYILYSVISGGGTGICYNALTFTISGWYPDKSASAIGVMVAAYGGGGAFIAPLCTYLITAFGIKQTFLIIGIAFLIIGLACATFIKEAPKNFNPCPEAQKKGTQTVSQRSVTVHQGVRMKGFWMHIVSMAFWASFYTCFSSLFVRYGQDMGMSLAMATLGVSVVTISNMCSRLIWGFVCSRIGWRKVWICGSCFYIAAALIIIFLGHNPACIFLGYMMLGLGYGSNSICNPQITLGLYGPKNSATMFGLTILGWVPFTIIVPRVGVAVLNATNYSTLAAYGIALSLISIIVTLFIQPTKNWDKLECETE